MLRGDTWRLDYPGTSVKFGTPADDAFFLSAPDVADPEIATDDTPRPRADGVNFGADYLGGRTVSLELGINGPTELEALAKAATLARAWRADALRLTPGAMATLTATFPGRERVLYGRPRRFAITGQWQHHGYLSAVADFTATDSVFYGPADESATVNFVPPPSGGFRSPVVTPLTTIPATSVPGTITVAGGLDAWPVVGIRGPITNPVVQVTNRYDVALAMTINAGSTIILDSRPWARSVTRASDGASYAGKLARGTRLADMALPPGRHEIALRGTDQTGTSRMVFAWRPAYPSL